MTNISLLEFIQKGTFGTLALNDKTDKIKDTIGKPEKISAKNIPGLIWKYGNLEIIFGLEGVACILFVVKNIDCLWKTINVDDIELFTNINSNMFEELLEKLGIKDYEKGMLIGDSQIYFFQNLVKVAFTNNILTSISVSDTQKII
jgi:hypothetical protein